MNYFGDMNVNWLTTALFFLNCLVFLSGYFVSNLHIFGKDPVGDVVIMILNCLFIIFFFLNIQSVSIVMQGVSHLCKTLHQKPVVTADDIAQAMEQYGRIKPFLSFLTFMYYCLVQVSTVIAMYMIIIGQNILASVLMALGFVMYLVIMLGDLLVIYHHMDRLTAKAKADAYRLSKTVGDLLRVKDQIAELEDYRTLTGLGFYDVGLPLVTSFLSTTLTYLIVLVQSEPLLNPSGTQNCSDVPLITPVSI